MTRLSPLYVHPDRMKAAINAFWDAVALCETRKEVVAFFEEFLTPTEKRMFGKRVAIAVMLLDGHNYQTIRTHLRVTDHTITKVNNWLKFGAGGFRKIIEKIMEIEEERQKKIEGRGPKRTTYSGVSGALTKFALQKAGEYLKRSRKKLSVKNQK